MTLTVGSLFSGIGGIDLAFELAGFRIAWQVEYDDYCNKVLSKHWPDVPRYGDVRTVTADIGAVDVLAGGFPCQPFSVAGRQRGADDERNMWPEFRRLIGELRPRAVFLENVPAIAAGYGPVVIGELAALGYDAEWGVISAADAGAPHKRERWWCVAYTHSQRCQNGRGRQTELTASGQNVADAEGQRFSDGNDRQLQRQSAGEVNAHSGAGSDSGRLETRQRVITQSRMVGNFDGLSPWLDGGQRWPAGRGVAQYDWEPPRTVEARSVPDRVARIKALGNAVVPQVVYPLAVEIKRLLQRMTNAPRPA